MKLEEKKEVVLNVKEEEKSDKIPWEKLVKPSLTSKDFAKVMTMFELDTYEKVRANPNLVISALQNAYSIDLSAINKAVREWHEENTK